MSGKIQASSWAKSPPPDLSFVGRVKDAFWLLADPWLFMAASISFFPGTIGHLVKNRDFSTLLSWDKLQTKWFGRFWSWAGPIVRSTGEERVVPLLEGRVSGGVITENPIKPGVHGVVVEVGAGSGMWIELFKNDYHGKYSMDGVAVASGLDASAYELPTKRSASGEVLGRSRVTKVYGVEPNPQSHEALTRRVKEAGLDDIYEVVPVGIEHLSGGHWKWEKQIEKESVDCVVSILCLCSIPDPEDNVRDLYQYLKPGGYWYVYEHVGCSSKANGRGMIWYQWFVNLFWPHIMGGCCLNRNTEQTLRNAGTWTDIDLSPPEREPWYHAVPHLYGVLRK